MNFQGKPFRWIGCSFNDVESIVKNSYPNIEIVIHSDVKMRCHRIAGKMYLGRVYKVKTKGTKLYVGLSADMRFYDMIDIFVKILAVYLSNDEYHRPLSRNAQNIYNDIKEKCKAIARVESENILKEVFN